jgi:hypothetical protein
MSLHAKILGGTEEAYRVARMIEGLLMAQVAMAVDRFGVADLLAAGPRTGASWSSSTSPTEPAPVPWEIQDKSDS